MEIPQASSLSMPSISAVPSMGSMPGMLPTFSSGARITLWFTDWTTTTTVTYVLSLIFLFSLGTLNRFLGALKSHLESKWSGQPIASHTKDSKKAASCVVRIHARNRSTIFRPQAGRPEEPEDQESEPLSPALQPDHADEGVTKGKPESLAGSGWPTRHGASAGTG